MKRRWLPFALDIDKVSLMLAESSATLARIDLCELVVSSRRDDVEDELRVAPLYFISKTFLSSLRIFVSNLVQYVVRMS